GSLCSSLLALLPKVHIGLDILFLSLLNLSKFSERSFPLCLFLSRGLHILRFFIATRSNAFGGDVRELKDFSFKVLKDVMGEGAFFERNLAALLVERGLGDCGKSR